MVYHIGVGSVRCSFDGTGQMREPRRWNDNERFTLFLGPIAIDAIEAQWKFSGDKHKSLQVDTERTFHQRYPLAML